MNRKIFISYNRKDQGYALRIRDKLVQHGLDVIIDVEQMRSGENIEHFIMECIRESSITLTLVSSNSLLSALVAMETMASNLDEKLRNRRFIACYIDKEFMDRSFTGKALKKIEENIQEIDELMTIAIEKMWGIEDLQTERTRYLKMKVNLPEIIGKLRNSVCIDVTDENFEAGMKKILKDLDNKHNGEAADVLNEKIHNTFDEIEKQRLISLLGRLSKLQQLLNNYEEKLDFETDPKLQMKYEMEKERIKKSIQIILDETHSYKQY